MIALCIFVSVISACGAWLLMVSVRPSVPGLLWLAVSMGVLSFSLAQFLFPDSNRTKVLVSSVLPIIAIGIPLLVATR